MPRLIVTGVAAALLIFGASSRVAIAQSPKPAPAPADEVTPISCIIYMEYEGEMGKGSDEVASNEDIEGSAKALSASIPGEAPLIKVDHHTTIDAALRSFLEPKNNKRSKCCKRIDIVGHGSTLGQLEVPRKHADDAPEQAGVETIGGSQADDADPKAKYPKPEQTRLLEFIASLTAAACPPPTAPTVHVQACYSVQGGSSGISTEIANFGGFKTTGYQGQCSFPHVDNPNGGFTWLVPTKKGDSSKEVTTDPPPPKEEEKVEKKEEKKPVRKSVTNQSKKKAVRQVQTSTGSQQTSKTSGGGMSPETAQTLGTVVGIGVGIGMGRRGDDGGRMMKDR